MSLYNLHYAGSRLYTPDKFEHEAGRIGVARALPAWALRNLAFGDVVLLASFEARRGVDGRVILDSEGKPVRLGSADAWGYFVVNGLNLDAPDKVRAELLGVLHVVKSEVRMESVERECGEYVVASVTYVRESLREIVERAEAIAKARGVRVKWFVTGTAFRPLAPHIRIEDVPFTRTLAKVFIEGDWTPWVTPPEAEADGRPLAFILEGSYSARRYRKMTPEEKAVSDRRRIEAANRGRRARAMANDDKGVAA